MKDLGYKIRKARERLDYKREYVAECLDISTEWYRKIETGEHEPKLSQLEKICEILKLDMVELFLKEGQVFNNYNQNGDYIANQHLSGNQKDTLYERIIQAKDAEIVALKEEIELLKKK